KTQQLIEEETALVRIYQSHGWKALTRYYRLRNGLLPEGTRRRDFSKKLFRTALRGSKVLPLGFWSVARGLYHYIPWPYGSKQRLKSWFFIRTKAWTENSQAYKFWYDHQGQFLNGSRGELSSQVPFTENQSLEQKSDVLDELPSPSSLTNGLALPMAPSMPL